MPFLLLHAPYVQAAKLTRFSLLHFSRFAFAAGQGELPLVSRLTLH